MWGRKGDKTGYTNRAKVVGLGGKMIVLFILSVVNCVLTWLLLGKSCTKDDDSGVVLFITSLLSTAMVFFVFALAGGK